MLSHSLERFGTIYWIFFFFFFLYVIREHFHVKNLKRQNNFNIFVESLETFISSCDKPKIFKDTDIFSKLVFYERFSVIRFCTHCK